MIKYEINGQFICDRCRKLCCGNCHERLMCILNGTWKEGTAEYEENKDLVGRKSIIKCLGPYCDKPCEFQLDKYTPYKEEEGIQPLINAIRYLGKKCNELIGEKFKNRIEE